jgi:hypothetical protein
MLMIPELDFSTILTIRQALAKATLADVKAEEAKKECITVFVKVQRALLPATSDDEIQEFVKYLLPEAIALRNDMTVEQAIYRCYFVGSSASFNPETAQIQEGEPMKGKVLLCMFPGLLRKHILRDGDPSGNNVPRVIDVPVVKAFVKLNTAFNAQLLEPSRVSAESTHLTKTCTYCRS